MARQQDDFIRTALRVPPDLHAAIHAAAEESGRTFNAEIVARLQRSFNSVSEVDEAAMKYAIRAALAIKQLTPNEREQLASTLETPKPPKRKGGK